jgi:hypothetical protein
VDLCKLLEELGDFGFVKKKKEEEGMSARLLEVVFEMLFWASLTSKAPGDGDEDEASGFRAIPNSSWISALVRPLPSRKAIFLSVDALRTSSSSRNFLACSITVSRLGNGAEASVSPSVGVISFNCACHDGMPAFFAPALESLIVGSVDAGNNVFSVFKACLLSVHHFTCLGFRNKLTKHNNQ